MKIFISWSGARSHAVAEHMSNWIKCVLQASEPWLSSRDIDRGAIWFSEISEQLSTTVAGIVCITQENKNRPWILFETGALAKGITSNRVCTFLVDLVPVDLQDPLAQFNHTLPDRASVWGLVRSLNSLLLERKLDERVLQTVFDTYWQQFEDGMRTALEKHPQGEKPEPRAEVDILGEILKNTRSLTQRMRDLESKVGVQRIEAAGFPASIKFEEGLNIAIDRMMKGEAADSVYDGLVMVHKIEPKIARQMVDGVQRRLREVGFDPLPK